jgi:two-component system, cell cycle sensor histidine kinase and response regulator CckA
MRVARAALTAAAAAASAAVTYALARLAPSAAGTDPRDLEVARLEHDLASVRTLLEEYMADREATELELRASEERYRMLAESIDDVVSLHDVDGVGLYFSASTQKTTGYDPAELVGRHAYDVVHPEDRDRVATDLRAAVLRGEMPLVEWRCRRKDDGYVWLETRSTLLRDENGGPPRVLCVSRDVSQRKRAERALHASEERYRLLIDRAAYGIYRATPDGRFLDVNPALARMLGYDSTDDLSHLDLARDVYYNPTDRDWLLARIREHDLADWVEVQWKRKDSRPIMVRLSSRMVRDADGRELYCEAIAEDVTGRNRQEELLRRSERMASLGHTLAGVAHELNNPLAAICGFAQLLLRSERPEDDRTALETISHEAARAGRIVKDLLTFSRRQEVHQRERVCVSDVARYIFDTQRYAMETRGIRHELSLDPNVPPVLADPTQLEQVLLNLVVNARQAIEGVTNAPGTGSAPHSITLRTGCTGGSVFIEVADNGPGIPPGELERIWDPFWTTKGEGEGTGLGLAVVHGIITEHGGTIEVESRIGSGTRFLIKLPIAGGAVRTAEVQARSLAADVGGDGAATDVEGAGASAAEQAGGHGGASRAGRPLDILIVDDEASILGFLTRYFTSRGHAVVAAHDGAHALRIAEQASFDVVVCDLRMPGMDGSDVIRRMRALPTCAAARYVVSTGDDADSSSRRRIDGLDVAAVVEKPYLIDELREAVEG